MSDPLSAARTIFTESLGSLMAHSIRGTQNHFRRHNLELELLVVADMVNQIRLKGPHHGATSVLQSRFIIPRPGSPAVGMVQARIYIHKDATRTLARICIAHEIFHLLLELSEYLACDPNSRVWKQVLTNKDVEDRCNQFAWELCRAHDKFNRDDQTRSELLYFPERLFDRPLSTDAAHQNNWPLEMALEPAKSVFLKTDPEKWFPKRA